MSPRVRLIALAVLFASPMVLSYALYYSGWRPDDVHPHGDLVTPPRVVADVELTALEGAKIRLSAAPRKWLLLYFGSSECAKVCEQALYKIRQVIAAQGKEAGRVRGVMTLTDTRALEMLRYQLKDYPDISALVGPSAEIKRFAREFDIPEGDALRGLHRIYVVDPLGNFMLSYPADADPSDIRKDLTRLLRVSRIG